MLTYDVVILGTGVGGLSTAIYLAENAVQQNTSISILVVAKGPVSATNTSWAQGGIAAVGAKEDCFDAHIQDTVDAGAKQNELSIVKKVVTAAPAAMQDLIRWGMVLDKKENGEYDLVKEGGHQFSRIWHRADTTGDSLQTVLVQKIRNYPFIELMEETAAVKVEQNDSAGFYIQTIKASQQTQEATQRWTNKDIQMLQCKQLVLATGGLGMVYEKTTNQKMATGDGLFLATQLNAKLKDLSFIQFHPTGLYESDKATTFLITEALRGAGAILRNEKGEDFMPHYDHRGALAPRDIVSRAIFCELKKSSLAHVYLDATMLSKATIEAHFPNIASACLAKIGIDICKNWIPVIPVEHYACGGVQVDAFGALPNLQGLYAVGEVACTGLHGANRLASNSLLEGLVFAKWAAEKMMEAPFMKPSKPTDYLPQWPVVKKLDRSFLQHCMTNCAGIEKTTQGLRNGLQSLQSSLDQASIISSWTIEDWENNVLYENAIAILKDALAQKQNKGVFFNLDFA